MRTSFLFLIVACFLISTAVQKSFAQGVTTAALNGTVTDATDYLKQMDDALAGKISLEQITTKSVPAARVTAVHVPTGTVYNTISRADGRYNLKGLQVGGPYKITVKSIGYKEDVRSDVFLGLGETKRVDFALTQQDATLKEIQVTGTKDSRFTASRTGAGTEISASQLQNLPTIARSFQDMVRTNPLAVSSSLGTGDDTGALNIAGQNNRYNNVQVDGAVINDIFGLSFSGAPGGQAGAQPISLDAIQAIQIAVAPFDVRQSGFTGGLVNSITRSGTNTLQGSAYFFGRNAALVGRSPDAARTAYSDFSEFTVGARLGGAIVPDKLFFFANVETRQRVVPLEIGLGTEVRGGGNFGVEPAVLDRIANIARTQYNYDPGNFGTFNNRNTDVKAFARLDWNIAEGHRLTLRHNLINATLDRGVDRTPLNIAGTNSAFLFSSVQNNTVLQINSTFGSEFTNEFRASFMNVSDKRSNFAGGNFPRVEIGVGNNRTVILGVEQFSHANSLNQNIFELTNDFTVFSGSHTITIGTHNEFFSSANVFFPWYFGMYFYGSVNDFQAGTPFGYINRFSTNESLYGKTPTANFSSVQLGLYVQDDWDVSTTLRLTGGLRADMYLLPTKPYANPIIPQVFPGYQTDVVPNAAVLLSPRVGFNYDASSGDRTFQIRGGTGIFTGRAPVVWLSNQYSNTGVDIATNFIFGPGAPNRMTPGFMNPAAPPFRGQNLLPGQYQATVNLIDPNFRLPQTWRSSLAVDKKLPFGFSATLEGVYSQLLNAPIYQNIRLGSSTANQIDGRPVYNNDGGNNRNRMLASSLDYVYLLTNTNQGYQYNVTASLDKRAGDGGESESEFWKNLGVFLSYTNSQSWDVNSNPGFIADENFLVPSADPNNLKLTRSTFDIPNRIVASLSYRILYSTTEAGGAWATNISLFYEGRSGRPFTYVYIGDPNRDNALFGAAVGGDAVFVPANRSQVSMTDADWNAFNTFIQNDETLNSFRGKVFERNAAREPWLNQLDLQIAQEIPTFQGQQLQISLAVLNVLNLLNPDWGHQQFVPLPPGDFSGQTRFGLVQFNGYETDGRPKLNFTAPASVFQKDNLFSRWQMQLSVRYNF